MVEEIITDIDKIFEQIDAKKNFLLSGGAGSGKTYSLVEVIKRVFSTNPIARVACITYTNVAVNQINARARYDNMRVSTIHDFLWDNIKAYQKNIKEAVIALIASEKISYSGEETLDEDYYQDKIIEYKEWKDLKKGIVSHDEILAIADYIFEHYPLLSKIVKDEYDFILIDEYQDTSVEVINILLIHLQAAPNKNILGFFGDSMQSIYDGTIGNIKKFVEAGIVTEILKEDNRRNPKAIIDVANKLRNDAVMQKAAEDANAPNYNKVGSIKFLYSDTISDLNIIKKTEYFESWDFNDSKETKELYLTHNLIAPKAGFTELMSIYNSDQITAYCYQIAKKIKEENIIINEGDTFGQVIAKVGIEPTGIKATFIEQNQTLFDEAKRYPFSIFCKIYLDKDQLIGSKKGTSEEERKKGTTRDKLIRHLFHIQECIYLYESGKYNEFIRQTGFKIVSIQSKLDLRNAIETLKSMIDESIESVIEFSHNSGVWLKNDSFNEFLEEKEYVYNRVKEVKYREFYNLYCYVEGFTPFSTQHNIKGAEFNNVFVVLDNGRWNNYNFSNLFLGGGTLSVYERTLKLFYVCCTRAKENLVIFFFKPASNVVHKVEALIGAENVIKID